MRGVKRGKGLGLKYVALKKERPVAQLLSLLSQDGKKNNTSASRRPNRALSPPLLLQTSAFLLQVGVIMVLRVNRADWATASKG